MLDLFVCSINPSFEPNNVLIHVIIVVRDRQQMLLSGFIQDMAKIDLFLPKEVYMWMLDECTTQSFLFIMNSYSLQNPVCLEIREDLAYAYFNVLCTLPGRIIEEIVTEPRVSRMFSLLGGRDDALNIERQIVLVKAEVIGIVSPLS